MDREALRQAFVPGLKSFTGATQVIQANRRSDRPDYPFITFSFNFNGLAPWEPIQRVIRERRVVESEDPEWDFDIKRDWTADGLLTISCDVIDRTSGSVSELAQKTQTYFRNVFNSNVAAQGVDDTWFRQVSTNATTFDVPGGQSTKEARYTVDAQIVVPLDYEDRIETIETVVVSDTNELLPAEEYDL